MATQTGALTVNGLLTAQASANPQILVAGSTSSLQLIGGTGTGSFVFPTDNSSGGVNLTVRGGNCTTGGAGDLLLLAGINGSAAYGDITLTGATLTNSASTAFDISSNGTFSLTATSTAIFDASSYSFATGNSIFDESVLAGGGALSGVAILQANSTSKGFLPPRMTTGQRDGISAVAGLVIFNTTTETLQFYDGFVWVDASGGGSSSSSSPMSYTEEFVNGDLSSSILTVTHNLGQATVAVQVFNNSRQNLLPDLITLTNSNTASVDLTSFAPITGTWSVIILA